jgi:transposase
MAALNTGRTRGTYLSALYKHLATQRGAIKAIVAVEHSILTSLWHMLINREPYHDLGNNHFARLNPEREPVEPSTNSTRSVSQ